MCVHARVRVRACEPPSIKRVFHVRDKSRAGARARDEGRARKDEGGFPLFFSFFRDLHTPIGDPADFGYRQAAV